MCLYGSHMKTRLQVQVPGAQVHMLAIRQNHSDALKAHDTYCDITFFSKKKQVSIYISI